MNSDDPGRRVSGYAVRAVSVLLPAGAVRERYRREFVADLNDLDRSGRSRYVMGVVSRCLALRWAVRGSSRRTALAPERIIVPRKPVLCRFAIHHRWRVTRNPDGEPYQHCIGCGADRYDGMSATTSTGTIAGNMAANLIGRPQ